MMFWNKIIEQRKYLKAEAKAIEDGKYKMGLIERYYMSLYDLCLKEDFRKLIPNGYDLYNRGLWNTEVYGDPDECNHYKQDEQYIVFLHDVKSGLFDRAWAVIGPWLAAENAEFARLKAMRELSAQKADQIIAIYSESNQLLIPSQVNELLKPDGVNNVLE